MKIGIIGLGVVGRAHKFGFEKLGHSVSFHDISYDTKLEDVLDTEVVYICVPTPSKTNGDCDTTIVENVIDDLIKQNYNGVISIKSTIKPGTTKKLCITHNTSKICFCPEFLRERSAETDFIEHNTLLAIGTDDDEVYDVVKKSHGDYPKEHVRMSATESEILKYYSNVYNAMRVIFANSMYELCNSFNADYDIIKSSFVKRGTSTGKYLTVNEKWRGYGGVCLPKDTKAIISLVEQLGLDLDLFKTIDNENDKFLTTVPGGMRDE
jgi:UDPglucose 6-dehydrogenase